MSFFKLSTGENVQSTGNAEMSGGKMEPIPDGTKIRAMVTEGRWAEYEGDRYINLRWDCVEGEYKKRVIYQKIRVLDNDANKRDKAIMMLAAIDANAGGKIMALDGEPTDMQLTTMLSNKPMLIKVAVWEINDKTGNWIQSVEGKNVNAKSAQQQQAPQKPQEPDVSEDMDGSIPF